MEGRIKIHLFTDEVAPARNLAEEALWLTSFLQAGLDCLHIRRQDASRSEIDSLLSAIPAKFYSRIVLHDYPELLGKFECGFQSNSRHPFLPGNISLSGKDADLSGADKELSVYAAEKSGRIRLLSRSCHTLAEAEEALDIQGFDFVTLSPIFDSISKRGYKSQFSASGGQERRLQSLTVDSFRGIDLSKVVALGGVTIESVPMLESMGFGGAALLGDIWRRPNGRARLLKYLLMRNFSLQFITDGKDVEETISQAVEVLKGGGRWIQVRMKEAPKEDVISALELLYPICSDYGATLLVDDHFELAAYCHGVHLGQEDIPVGIARQYLSEEKIVGLTVNNRMQIDESLEALPDYYGVGPFRYTTTKKRLAPVLGIEGYRDLSPVITIPFVAIGGIRVEDIPSIIEAGASGIAVSSLITHSPDPKAMTSKLVNIIFK